MIIYVYEDVFIYTAKRKNIVWGVILLMQQKGNYLNEKEKNIIIKRYFDGRTQMEVADEIGISQAQVSRLEKNALENIKRYYKQMMKALKFVPELL